MDAGNRAALNLVAKMAGAVPIGMYVGWLLADYTAGQAITVGALAALAWVFLVDELVP